ncbi:hypothetical protein [Agriterribacter sp.]|uniref:hypothetical protein n=1 Tax=Agriterribacter sp. TaxID=2821509 RepID=UPI002C9EB8E6|nr:hypothetical protein [Agriterribacter sp.]HRO48207.1 hypothetical protein [Agriterribacter sp.]HRQ18651.1 hypothetical protein [Agriterribacter sp.]
MKKISLLVVIILLASFLPFILSSVAFKYILLGCGILFGLFSDIANKEKYRYVWLFFKVATASCFVAGIAFIVKEDKNNANNFKALLVKSDSIFNAQSINFKANNTELKGILNNISSFQQRQFNPLPDSCYFMFDFVIDHSKINFKSQIINMKFFRVEGKDSLFTFNFKTKYNRVLEYISALNSSIVLTFSNKSSKIKYYTTYHHSPYIEKIYCNQKDEIVFRYNLVPAIDFEGAWDYLDLKLIKSSSHNFISALDFENCTVKMCFGTLYYDKSKGGPVGDLKARIANAKVLLDFNGVDFIEINDIKQDQNESMNFIGRTERLIINSLKDDCLSPLYVGDQWRRGGVKN